MIIFTDSLKETISKMRDKKGNIIQFRVNKNMTDELKQFCEKYDTTPQEINKMLKNDIKDFSYCKECGKKIQLGLTFCSGTCRNNNKEWQEKYKKISLEKYGTDNPSKAQEIKDKIVEVNKEKFGVEYFSQSDEYKEKNVKTLQEKYGEGITNVFQLDEVKEKIKQTWKEKYGTDNLQNEEWLKEKIKQRNLEKYGVDWPQKLDSVKEKARKTCMEKYGYINASMYPEIKNKIDKTMQERYGVTDNISQSEYWKKKFAETSLERYGTKHPLQSEKIKEKVKKTNLERYGSEYLTHNVSYKLDDIIFDSSWEIVFYIYHKDKGCDIKRNDTHFTYIKDDKEHDTVVDFNIDGKLYEVKSSYFISSQEEKLKVLLENNVEIISDDDIGMYFDYVKEKYGNDYIKQFRIK